MTSKYGSNEVGPLGYRPKMSKYYNRDCVWSTGPPVCLFWLRGRCNKDFGECKFSHTRDVGDKTKVPICKFWMEGNCMYGDGCTFRHATNNVNALTDRYNAQLLASASQGVEYVWDPILGMSPVAPALPSAPPIGFLPPPAIAPVSQRALSALPVAPVTSPSVPGQYVPSQPFQSYLVDTDSLAHLKTSQPQLQTVSPAPQPTTLAPPFKAPPKVSPTCLSTSTPNVRKRERELDSTAGDEPHSTKRKRITY